MSLFWTMIRVFQPKSLLLLLLTLGATTALADAVSPRAKRATTLLIYYSGDNNLGNYMRYSLDRVIKEGGSPDVNVVVQYDGINKNDSLRLSLEGSGADRSSRILEKNVEYDMGKVQTLVDFVQWGTKNFPSEKTILMISAHGRGVLNVPANDSTKFGRDSDILAMASSADESSGSYMNETSLVRGLEKILGGKKLDLIIYNACMMGNLEVMSMFASVAHYAIASEYSIYVTLKDGEKLDGRGISFENILAHLKANPQFNERDLARDIMKDFKNSYLQFESIGADPNAIGGNRLPSTLAFYDLSKIDLLAREVSRNLQEFTAITRANPKVLNRFFQENMLAYYVDTLGYIDIMNLHGALAKSMDPVGFQQRQKHFKSIVDQVVLEKVGLFAESNEELGHLSFFFPRISSQLDYVLRFTDYYAKIPVTQKYAWDKFTLYFWTEAIQRADEFWVSLLQEWNTGKTVYIEVAQKEELADEFLFLYLNMLPIKWQQHKQTQKLQDYLQFLRGLHRQSPHLQEHIRFTESLLK